MKKSNTKSPKHAYQIIFTILASAFAINLVWGVWNALNAYNNSQPKVEIYQISLVLALIVAVLPVVLFGISHAVVRGDRWSRLYRASLLTLGAMLIVWSVKTLFYLSGYFLVVVDTSSLWLVKLELVPVVIGLIPFFIVALKIKRQNLKKVKQLEKHLLVGGASAILIATVVQEVYMAASQELFSVTHILALLVTVGVSALLFLPVYLQEKKRPRFDRVFRGVLVAVTVMFFWMSISQLTIYINLTQINALLTATVYTVLIASVFLSYVFLRRQVRTLPW